MATVIVVAFSASAFALDSRWVLLDPSASGDAALELVESSPAGCVIDLRVPRIRVENIFTEGGVFQRLSLPGAGFSGRVGHPELPVYSVWLAIPRSSSLKVEVISSDEVELEGYRVRPVAKPLPEMVGPSDEFQMDRAVYSRNAPVPEGRTLAGQPCVLRDQRIAQVLLFPVVYNPARSTIDVATHLRVRVAFTGYSGRNVPRRTDSATEYFEALERDFLLNYEPEGPNPASYLIITADEFKEAIAPLADWKNRKGLPVHVTALSAIPPGDSAAIHDHIKDAYNSWPVPPECVLLVGDVEFLPAGMHEGIYPPPAGEYFEFGTDHCYSLVAGDDVLSDVLVGRLPVNSAQECSVLVEKLLDYETAPYTLETDWFEEAATVGVYQPGRIFQPTCLTVRSIMLASGYARVDTLFEGASPPGFATPQDVCDSLNDGRTFLLYRGHGSQTGWWTDGSYNILSTEHVDTLKNGRENAVIIAPTCLANAFFDEGQECMGEAFLLQEQGAVGYFGAADVSYSFWNDSLAIGIYRGIFEEGYYRFQQGCNYGKLFMEKYFPLNDPGNGEITEQEFFFMNALGDPDLPLWTDTPRPLVAVHADTVGTGPNLLTILVQSESSPVGDALVCVMKGTESYASGYTDGSGRVQLLATPLTEGNMDVTATAQNCLPYSGSIAVVSAPAVPELLSPSDLAVLADTAPPFVWSSTAGDGGWYELDLAEDSLFGLNPRTIDSLTDTFFVFPEMFGDGRYYWRVCAFNQRHSGSGFQTHPFSLTIDCAPPEFSQTTVVADTCFEGPFTIASTITDLSGVFSPTLSYRVDPDTSWISVPMDSAGVPDSFRAEIPRQPFGVTVDYYLDARDFSNPANRGTDPAGAPAAHYSFRIISVGVEESAGIRIPTDYSLSSPSPNPFRVESSVLCGIPHRSSVRMDVYDAAGRRIRCILDRSLAPGYHSASWDGTDSRGEKANPGVYFVVLHTSSRSYSEKILYLR